MNVSVVIPCYNAEKYLGQTVSSVLKQTRLPDEIVFIDDGSTDNTKEILRTYGDMLFKYQDKKYLHQEIKISIYENDVNRGIGYTRQKGIDVADGDYIAFLSSDDVWHERFLEKSMDILESMTLMYSNNNYPNMGTYTDYYRCDKDLKPFTIFRCPEFSRSNVIDWALQKNMFINFSSIVFHKMLPVMFESQLRRGEDLVFLLDTLLSGFYWFRIDEPLLYYRVMGGKFDLDKFLTLWSLNKDRLIKLGVDPDLVEKKFNESYRKVTMTRSEKLLKRLFR